MKSFIYGLSGFFVGLIIYLAVLPLYSDYSARAETVELIYGIEGLQRSLEEGFQKTGKFDGVLASKTMNQGADPKPIILENGTIIVRGHIEGQLLVVAPKVEGGKVQWRCYVGPRKTTPIDCLPEGQALSSSPKP